MAARACSPIRRPVRFAHSRAHRLGAEGLEHARASGLDARDRGNLLHALMAQLWGTLRTKSRLDAMPPDELAEPPSTRRQRAVAKVRAQRAGRARRTHGRTRTRAACAARREWLAVERARDDFEVVAREEKRTLAAGRAAHSPAASTAWTG